MWLKYTNITELIKSTQFKFSKVLTNAHVAAVKIGRIVMQKANTINDSPRMIMETIFDHNPTDQELKRFGGRERYEWIASQGLHYSQDDNYYQIGMLYAGRGDKKKANEYWSKIKNKEMLTTLIEDF